MACFELVESFRTFKFIRIHKSVRLKIFKHPWRQIILLHHSFLIAVITAPTSIAQIKLSLLHDRLFLNDVEFSSQMDIVFAEFMFLLKLFNLPIYAFIGFIMMMFISAGLFSFTITWISFVWFIVSVFIENLMLILGTCFMIRMLIIVKPESVLARMIIVTFIKASFFWKVLVVFGTTKMRHTMWPELFSAVDTLIKLMQHIMVVSIFGNNTVTS